MTKSRILTVWALTSILSLQQGIQAAAKAPPSIQLKVDAGSVLATAGSSYFEPVTGTSFLRVTDVRDGDSISVAKTNATSFNSDASAFVVSVDGEAVVFALDAQQLTASKTRVRINSNVVSAEDCQWSATDASKLFVLEGSPAGPVIMRYDMARGTFDQVRLFSDLPGTGQARGLSKCTRGDDQFAFAWRPENGAWKYIVVWNQSSGATYLFDLMDSNAGVAGFRDAHLDRSGDALIVNGATTRVWRYQTSSQQSSILLDSTSNVAAADSYNLFDDLTRQSEENSALGFPRDNASRDGRFVIFDSLDASGRRDVFIAANFNAQSTDAATDVVWGNTVNCEALDSVLRKIGGSDNSDDAYATSSQTVEQGDTFVDFTVSDQNKERWCGFNNSNQLHQSTSDINFALRLSDNKKLFVVENGIVRAKTKYKQGNTFRIAVESGVVNYYRNGSVFYTSSSRPQYPLSVNASLVSIDSSIERVVVAGASLKTFVSISPTKVNINIGQTCQFTAIVIGGANAVNWRASQGTVTSGGLYTPPSVTGAYTVTATSRFNPNASAIANVFVRSGPDTTPPVITQVSATSITSSAATVSWTTNEAADSIVVFGPTTAYGGIASNSTLSLAHSNTLSGLAAGTRYHFSVRSKDAAGNVAASADSTFTTSAVADTAAPVITAVAASGISTTGATVTWTTNEPADAQVEYGTSTAYGASTIVASALVTTHSLTLSSLAAGTLYHYRVKSKDAAGNLARSSDATFSTQTATSGGPGKTDYGIYPEPPPPSLPRAGGTFVDPVFGTTIMRVTDENDGPLNTTNYSYWHSLNKNSTRLYIVAGNSPTLYAFDPVNFRISGKRPLYINRPPVGSSPDAEDSIWSGVDPDVMYGHDGLRIWAYNVASNSYTLVKDLSGQLPAGWLWQMSKSADDNVFGFTVKNSSGATTGYCSWRRDNNSLYLVNNLPGLDEVQVDKTGQWLVVKTGKSGAGAVRVQVVNLQTRAVQDLVDGTPDYAPGHSDNGAGSLVGYDNWLNRVTYRRASSAHQLYSALDLGNDWSIGFHLSMLEDDDAWALMSTYVGNSLPSSGLFKNELLLVATDGSKRVRRIAHTHSVYREYWDTPRATISRDGRFAVFTSNWGTTARRDVFIVWISGSSSAPPPPPSGDATPPSISGVGASSVTATGAIVSWTTNEMADSQVEFGTTTGYGASTAVNSSMVTSHSAVLAGLASNTSYHYRVKSRDAAGNLATSSDFTFTTSGGGGGGTGGSAAVTWISVVNCSATGNTLQKNGGYADTPDAGGRSQQALASGDGYVEFTATEADRLRFCGFTHSVLGTDYTAIDFAIKLTTFGVAEVRENNVYRSETPYASGDVFRIAVLGGVVKYSKNGAVFYTSGARPSYPLVVDASLLTLSATITNTVIAATAGGTIAQAAEALFDGRSSQYIATRLFRYRIADSVRSSCGFCVVDWRINRRRLISG